MLARPFRGALALSAAAALAVGACSDGGSQPALSAKAREGQSVYRANCTACHNMDPKKPGGVGPAVAGASLELLRAKVLRGEYPPGYEPKRDTTAMPPLPHLEESLPALAAYLDAVAEARRTGPPAEGPETKAAAPSSESAAAP